MRKKKHASSYIGEISLVAAAFGVTVMAFDGLDNGLMANLTLNPTHVKTITDGESGAQIKGAESVFVSGDYAYITSRHDNSLQIIDVSEPFSPVVVGSISDGEGGAHLKGAWSVAVEGDHAFVAAKGSNALEIIDVSDPANPTHTAAIVHGEQNSKLLSPLSVTVAGGMAYVASYVSDSFEVIDVTDPSQPVRQGGLQHGDGGQVLLDGATSVAVSGNKAYVTAQFSNSLQIIDISDPENPFHAGVFQSDHLLRQVRSVYIEGDYAYVTARSALAFHVIDISDPLDPRVASSVSHGGEGVELNDPRAVVVAGDYAYIASNRSDALEIIDISEKNNTAHALSLSQNQGSIAIPSPTALFLANGLLYVTSGGNPGSLQVISPFPDRELVADQESIEFGSHQIGESHTETITLTNTGFLPIEIGQIDVDDDSYSIINDSCSEIEFEPHTQCGFEVEFSPSSSENIAATVEIPNDSGAMSIAVNGAGALEGSLPLVINNNASLTLTDTVDLEIQLLGVSINYGQGGPQVPVELSTNIGGTEYEIFYGTESDVTGEVVLELSDIETGSSIDMEGASFHPSYSWWQLYRNSTADDSQMILALQDGDSVPDLTPFGQQPNITEFLDGYIDENGIVTIGSQDIIYLFELGTDNPQNSAADFQDAVLLLSFSSADEESEEQVTLCHLPPGNPENAHTLTVGAGAVNAHLNHGDYLGECE